MREYAASLGLVLLSFSTLFIIFTFFELIGDIIRNKTPLVTVGDYLLNLIPFILYQVTPLCALVAVLVTFGALSRSSEITAMKATGVSLYRVVAPVLVLTLFISAGLFAFDEFYLPAANRRQEALRSVIKDKPAQTFLRPDRKWISGQTTAAGQPARIFYYQYFDADRNAFANLTVFEFEPNTFNLKRRIFATSARWNPDVEHVDLRQRLATNICRRRPSHHISHSRLRPFPRFTSSPRTSRKRIDRRRRCRTTSSRVISRT